ncbi:hypothetical protein [uncultured Enterococcus sp.]|uniref:hypothetical protein n=1 Tax=uncultured Enterococcus sp. TaxID=167972 RepID=UPI002AA70542|nr:hypothetical protein [uncultured Enterococcus sp.]
MIKIELKNEQGNPIIGKIDHEKEPAPFAAEGEELAVLAIKEYTYETGDKIVITSDEAEAYFIVQLDETLAPSLIYFPQKTWEYHIPTTKEEGTASVDTGFRSKRHHLMVRKAHNFEVNNYQNLAVNSHDQKEASGVFPHAYANVETRGEAVFFAKNAIDGKLGNLSHGSYPFASWGINQQKDAALTIDFGRKVEIDWVRVLFRADYPHDSYWTEITLVFSDGEEHIATTDNSLDFQEIRFPTKQTETITLTNLKKAEDESPFPALTQIEVFGKTVK